MWKNKKGVSPLIATVLLLLVAMGIGALVWGFMQEFVQEQTSTAATTSTELAECSKASFKITSCAYTDDANHVLIKLENTGSIDINDFWVNVQYSDGTASQTLDTNDLLAGSFVKIAGYAGPSLALSTIKVQSYLCTGVKDSTTVCP